MSIPPHVLLAELRRYAVACEGDAARARVIADAAWAQYRQASADERDDTVAEALIQHRARGLKSARSATKDGERSSDTTTPVIHTSATMGFIALRLEAVS